MKFDSRDAFPARGGVGDERDRFPLGPSGRAVPTTALAEPRGAIDTQSPHSRHAPVTGFPLPSGAPGWETAPTTSRSSERAGYVELHAHSAYSFLDGASLPEELAARAVELGYDALALTDHDGVYGSLEFARAAKDFGLRAITGAELSLRGVGSTEQRANGGA